MTRVVHPSSSHAIQGRSRCRVLRGLAFAAPALLLAACASTPPTPPPTPMPPATSTAQEARANLASASGSLVSGSVTLRPMGDGVHLTGTVGGFAANSGHGFHVHEKGDCSAADASSAGDHFNPTGAAHGRSSRATPHHAGDMDNIVANGDGVAQVDVHLHGVTLGGGAANDIAGRALVVHVAPDDYTSQPSGNAGARVACAVITVVR
jgi:Cu-Zn family superoxide dismutase